MKKSIQVFASLIILGGCSAATPNSQTASSITTTYSPATTVVVTTAQQAAPTTTATKRELSFTIAVSGDILPHSQLWRGAQRNAAALGQPNSYDFRPMFGLVKPLIEKVDLAICHLETPIAPADQQLSTYPFFGVPHEITHALAEAGFDRCSTASNHAMDRGVDGIDATLDALDNSGISHTGMARTPEEIEPHIIFVNEILVAHMSYTFSYNGLPAAGGQNWRSALINTERISNDVKAARSNGAEVVLISLHWGNERQTAPSSYQRQVAETITASGQVDLIIGSHAHVLQPIEKVNGTWVIYGLGNFLSNMPTTPKDPPWPASTQDGALVTTTIKLNGDRTVTVERPVVIPTWVDKISGWQIRNVVEDLENLDITGATRSQLEASLKRTTKVLGAYIGN